MPRKSLAPGFIKIFQSTTISGTPMSHVQTLSIAGPTWLGALTTLLRKSGAAVVWTTAVTELIVLLRPLMGTGTTYINAEIWRQDTATDDPLFISTVAIALAGTNGAATLSAGQAVIDFKGADDSDLRFTLLEPAMAANRRLAYLGMTAAEKALCDYIVGATTWLYTRGNSFPVNVGFLTSKTNDVLRKSRLNL